MFNKTIISGFFNKGKVVLGKEEILSILPHRERMLLLDEVTITDKKVVGKFTVTEEVCHGHQFNGQLLFRGVDTVEMAAQALGVWLSQYPDSEGKIAFFRKIIGEVKFSGRMIPSDVVSVTMLVEKGEEGEPGNPRIEISGRPGRTIERAIVKDVVISVGKDVKARIGGIELSIVSIKSLAK